MNPHYWRAERAKMEKLAEPYSKTELIVSLNQLLADLFTEFVSLKQRHWHIQGETFRDIHEFFDANTDQILEMIDDIGEYIVSFGYTAVSTIPAITLLAAITPSPDTERHPQALLQNGLDAMIHLKKSLSHISKIADEEEEFGVTNVVQDMITRIDKMIYKYQAYLSKFN